MSFLKHIYTVAYPGSSFLSADGIRLPGTYSYLWAHPNTQVHASVLFFTAHIGMYTGPPCPQIDVGVFVRAHLHRSQGPHILPSRVTGIPSRRIVPRVPGSLHPKGSLRSAYGHHVQQHPHPHPVGQPQRFQVTFLTTRVAVQHEGTGSKSECMTCTWRPSSRRTSIHHSWRHQSYLARLCCW